MEKYKFQAKSEDGLLDKALNELKLKKEDVITRSYEEKGGLFSGKKYTLEVIKISDVAEVGKEIIKELLSSMGVNANVETKIRDGQIYYGLHSQNNSLLIGKNGHILDSIQTYVRQAVLNTIDLYVNITIDVEGYKEKREKTLKELANKVAKTVINTKKSITLEPMKPYERKIIHSQLQNNNKVETTSIGEEPRRRIVVSLKK